MLYKPRYKSTKKIKNQTSCTFHLCSFYRAMHFSAKRGIVIRYCPSVRLSECNVQVLWSHRLEFFENNFTAE